MRGLVYLGDNKAELTDELEVRAPGPREVIVRIVAAGLCHTDLSVIDGTIPWQSPSGLGHEGAGIVEEVGSAVTMVGPGDHVVVSTLAYCGACKMCNSGRPTLCRQGIGRGSQPFSYRGEPCSNFAATSSLVERIVVSDVQAVRIPDDVPLNLACLIACGVLTGAGAVWNTAQPRRGDNAVVFGVGGIGLSAIQALQIAGASRVVAVDIVAAKEPLARAFGATDFIAAEGADIVQEIRRLFPYDGATITGPFSAGGVDWAFDCVGSPRLVRAGLDVLDWGGTAVCVGVTAPGVEFSVPVNHLVHLDRRVIGTRYGEAKPHRDVPYVIELFKQGRFPLDKLASRTYPIEQWSTAAEDLRAGRLARGVLTF